MPQVILVSDWLISKNHVVHGYYGNPNIIFVLQVMIMLSVMLYIHGYHDNYNIIFVLQMMIMWSVMLYIVTMTIIILYLYYITDDDVVSYVVHGKVKKNICVFTVTCQKNLGLCGQHYFFFFFYYRQSRK